MGRLIDADKIIDKLGFSDREIYCKCLIADQPTAFDVEAVVEELEEEMRLADKEKERCARENPLQFDNAKGYANGIANAIEIVKKGGAK